MAETFAAAVADRRSFRGDSAEAWLYGIARHQLSGWYRRAAVERKALGRLGLEPPLLSDVEYERVEELAGLADLRARVASLLEALPDEAREALQLRIVEERPYPEVADALGIAEPAARARVSRALRGLAAELEDEREAAHGRGLIRTSIDVRARRSSWPRARTAPTISPTCPRWRTSASGSSRACRGAGGAGGGSRWPPCVALARRRDERRRDRGRVARDGRAGARSGAGAGRADAAGRDRGRESCPGERPRPERPALGDPGGEVEDRLHVHDGRAGQGRDVRADRARRRVPAPARRAVGRVRAGRDADRRADRRRQRPQERALDRVRRRARRATTPR